MITTGESKIFHDSTGEKSGSQFADTMTHPARRVKSEFLGGFYFGGCYNLNMTPDSELLARLARTRSEATFAELVRRHVNLVYSTALRQVNGDAHLAQEVAQTIFTDLARNADSLSHRENLTGWLYTSAYFAATKTVRGETHRRNREENFMRVSTLLRYFEEQPSSKSARNSVSTKTPRECAWNARWKNSVTFWHHNGCGAGLGGFLERRSTDGTWHCIYGLAHGSVQLAISDDGHFDAWEKANTYSPPQNQYGSGNFVVKARTRSRTLCAASTFLMSMSTSEIMSAMAAISASFMPRVVQAGVPRRMPLA